MIYLLALFVPPIAVLLKGKPMTALLNLVLTALGFIPVVIHAMLVVNDANAEERINKIEKALKDREK